MYSISGWKVLSQVSVVDKEYLWNSSFVVKLRKQIFTQLKTPQNGYLITVVLRVRLDYCNRVFWKLWGMSGIDIRCIESKRESTESRDGCYK